MTHTNSSLSTPDTMTRSDSVKRPATVLENRDCAHKTNKTHYLAFPHLVKDINNSEWLVDMPTSTDSTNSNQQTDTVSTSQPTTNCTTLSQSSASSCQEPLVADSIVAAPVVEKPWGKLTHKFKFLSSYSHNRIARLRGNCPEVTTKHSGNSGQTVDYIFYTG